MEELEKGIGEIARQRNGPEAYAPPRVRQASGIHAGAVATTSDPGHSTSPLPKVEWPGSVVPRPELEKKPETPTVVHEAATDLEHVFEACAVAIERARDKLQAETLDVCKQATGAVETIREMKHNAIAALHAQTQHVRQTSGIVVNAIEALRRMSVAHPVGSP